MSSRSAKERIRDILNAIDGIQTQTAGMSFEEFSQNKTIVKAVLYDLIVIGEAAINIPTKVSQNHSFTAWGGMAKVKMTKIHV